MKAGFRPGLATSALAALVLAVGARPVQAHRPVRERARTFLTLRLADALDLPDEKALQVGRIIRKADEQRVALLERRRQVEEKLRAALEQSPPPAEEITRWVAEANAIDEQLAGIPQQSLREIQQLLTLEQQAKLVLLRPELREQIRRAARAERERGQRQPWRPWGRGREPADD